MTPMRERGWGEAMRRLLGGRRDGLAEPCLDLVLVKDGTWSAVVDRTPIEVTCALGLVMITCEGDAEDHVLLEGATFVARRPGRLAIWALQPARLRVATAARRFEAATARDSWARSGEAG